MNISEIIKDINILLVIFIIWTLIWILYNFIIRPHYKPNPLLDDPMTKFKINVPDWAKCWIKPVSTNPKNNDCSKENIDGWTIGHLLIYITIGIFIKNIDVLIIIVSVFCEIWEYFSGWRARWILDPITNYTGYFIGKNISTKFVIPTANLSTCNLLFIFLLELAFCHPKIVGL